MSFVLFAAALLLSFDVAASRVSAGKSEPVRELQQSIDSDLITATAPPADRGDYSVPLLTQTPTPINIGNFVWNDLDKDGQQDAGEPGFPGVSVQLWNPEKNDLIDIVTTNDAGNYTLSAPHPGSYRVRAVLPGVDDEFSPKDKAGGNDNKDSDMNPAGPHVGFTAVIDIGPNATNINKIDIGIIKFIPPTATPTPEPINIGNFVWHDLDQDGKQDANEPGIPSVSVQLWNASKTNLLDNATTNASGKYKLSAPGPGSYRVRVVPPSGTAFTLKNKGSDTLDSDINPSGVHVGFTAAITIGSATSGIMHVDAGLVNAEAVASP